MFFVPIQEAKEELESYSKTMTNSLLDEYEKDTSDFRSLFTREQFGLILAIADTYARSMALELYDHFFSANLPESPISPEPQAETDEHDPLIPETILSDRNESTSLGVSGE